MSEIFDLTRVINNKKLKEEIELWSDIIRTNSYAIASRLYTDGPVTITRTKDSDKDGNEYIGINIEAVKETE